MTDQPPAGGEPTLVPLPEPKPQPAAPPKRRRWKKILLWTGGVFVGLVALVLLLAPPIVSSVGRGKIVDAINGQIDGKAELGSFSFSWPCSVRLRDLSIRDAKGDVCVFVKEVAVDVALLKAIGGTYVADVRVEEPIVTATRDAEGRINLLTLAKPPPPEAAPKEPSAKKPKKEKAEKPLPTVIANVAVSKARVAFVDAKSGRTTLEDVSAKVTIDTLDKPIDFEVVARGSLIALRGKLTVAKEGRLDLDNVNGTVSYELDDVRLSTYAPVVTAFAPVTKLEGTLRGKGEYRILSMTSVSGAGDFELAALHVEGPAVGPDPVRFARLKLSNDVAMDADGTGTQMITAEAGDFVRATIQSKTTNLLADGRIGANVAVTANLKGVTEAAGTLLKMKSGYRLGGDAAITADLRAELADKAWKRATCDAEVKLDNLSAKDDQGRDLPMDPSLRLTLKAEGDAAGTVLVKQGDFAMGAVTATARGGVDVTKRTVSDSVLRVDADLDALAKKVASFMDLGFSFGGKVKVDAGLQGSGDVAKASAIVNLDALRVTGFQGKDIGPLDVVVRGTGTVDLRAGGRSTIEKIDVVSDMLNVDCSGEATDILNPDAVAGSLKFDAKVRPAALQQRLGAFFAGYTIAGADSTASGEIAYRGKSATVRAKIKASDFRIDGAAKAAFRDLVITVDADAGLDQSVDARDVTITCGVVEHPSATVKAVVLKAAARKKGDDLELTRLELQSSVASGGGSATIKGLMKEGMSAAGRLDFRGDVAPLVEIARAYKPELKDVRASGTWELTCPAQTEGKKIAITPRMNVRALSLDGYVVGGKTLTVANADVVFDSKIDVLSEGAGRADIASFSLTAPGVGAKGSGTMAGFLAGPRKLAGTFKLDATVSPDELTKRLSAFLYGYALAGDAATAAVELGIDGDSYTAKGKVLAPKLDVTMPEEKDRPKQTISQRDLVADFDVAMGATAMDIRSCRYASKTGTASVVGKVTFGEKMDADVKLTADAQLADVARDFGSMMGLTDYALRGKLHAAFDVRGSGQLKAAGAATVEAFELESKDGKRVGDPKIECRVDIDVDSALWNVSIGELRFSSSFLRGTLAGRVLNAKVEPEFRGLKGDFVYVPDKLGAVAQPWLGDAKLSGAEEQKLAFTLDGKAKEYDALAILRSAAGAASLDLAQYTTKTVDVKGGMKVDIKDQRAKVGSGLDLNRGRAALDCDVDFRDAKDARSTAKVQMTNVDANAGMSEYLSLIHPMFALGEKGLDGMLGGKIDVDFGVSYDRALTKDALYMTGGWDKFDKKPINGRGHFEIRDLMLQGTPLLTQLLAALGVDAPEELHLQPIDFTIESGRVRYAKPVLMRISKVQTFWTGTIGLDQTLDLVWEIPVTERLLKKMSFLKYWKDKTIHVPVKGTCKSPKVMFDELFADLAKQAAQKAIEEKAGGAIEDLLGGKKEKEAKKLLEDADKLYAEGKKKDAAPIYFKLYNDFDKTPTYKANKERIRQRMQE